MSAATDSGALHDVTDGRHERAAEPPNPARWVISVAALVYALGVALLAFGVYVDLPGPLAAYGDPTAGWPIAVQLAAGVLSIGTWRWATRRKSRPFAVVLLAMGILTVLVLASASYAACPDRGLSTGWSVVTRVVGLLTNNYAIDMFAAPACGTDGVPLALQFARLAQLIVVLVAATSAVIALLRTQVDRMAVSGAPGVSLAMGVDAESSGLLKSLAETTTGSVLAVLAPDPSAPWVASARAAGWRVIVGDANDERVLRRLLCRARHRHVLRDLFVFSTPGLVASRQLGQVMAVLGDRSSREPVRALLRIDNRWQSEHLRQQSFVMHPSVIVDTVSKYEASAMQLVDDLRERGSEHVVLLGRSELTFAVIEELAQQRREQSLLHQDVLPDVTVMGAQAREVVAEQEAASRRYGRPLLPIAVDERSDPRQVMAELGTDRRAVALVFTDDANDDDQRMAALVGSTFPSCQVYVSYADIGALQVEPLFGNVRAFATSLVTGHLTVGRWARLASIIHDDYVTTYPDPKDPSRRPWDELSDFYRESNIRLVTTVVRSTMAAGRMWGASEASETPVTREQLDQMARDEHESWFHFMRSHGWRWGSTRDRNRRRHPDLLPWDQLTAASQEKARKGVTDSLALLETLGYRSYDPSTTWTRFRRRGEVSAVRRYEPWDWTTRDGTVMHGDAGDWQVTDESGSARSIVDSVFTATHEQVSGDRWARVGEVRGRLAQPGEVVQSLEGDQTAKAGQWVLRGVEDEEWLVSPQTLERTYDRI